MLSTELRALIRQYLRGVATPDDLLSWCQSHGQAVHDVLDTDPTIGELYASVWEAADALVCDLISPVDFTVLMEQALEVGMHATPARP